MIVSTIWLGATREQVGPVARLAIRGIFDFDPRGRREVGTVRRSFLLRLDVLEVACAAQSVEVASPSPNVVGERTAGDEVRKDLLALDQLPPGAGWTQLVTASTSSNGDTGFTRWRSKLAILARA